MLSLGFDLSRRLSRKLSDGLEYLYANAFGKGEAKLYLRVVQDS